MKSIWITWTVGAASAIGVASVLAAIPGCGGYEYNGVSAHYNLASELEREGHWDAAVLEFHAGCTAQLEADPNAHCRLQEQQIAERAKADHLALGAGAEAHASAAPVECERPLGPDRTNVVVLADASRHYNRATNLIGQNDWHAAVAEFRCGCDLALSVGPSICREQLAGIIDAARAVRDPQGQNPATPVQDAPVPVAPAPAAITDGCSKDTDCKGTRVCENRVCVKPVYQ